MKINVICTVRGVQLPTRLKISDDISGIRSELANTRDRVSKLEAITSDTRDTLQSTEYDNEQHDYESLNRKCNKVNNTVSKLHKRVLTIEESITGIRKAGTLLNRVGVGTCQSHAFCISI